ncbi:hypothetical protein HPB48_021684 [Haemaphysalis longicornis]|uniref:Myb/SANT-like DNA-binding domain-containing protein n=1 Tax=Haemaphysalis longicornis TaxID=44386 RepID=A0A9J6FPZ3_HAELO|nr:hypothetical protein HPB48_021684 [Haemaphysalis longicornis]
MHKIQTKKRKFSSARNLWTTNATQKRNAGVYADITEALRKLGIERTVAEVRYKIKNLTQMYRDGVKGLTTGSGPIDWPHFERVRELIGPQPSNDRTLVQESQCTVDERTAKERKRTSCVCNYRQAELTEQRLLRETFEAANTREMKLRKRNLKLQENHTTTSQNSRYNVLTVERPRTRRLAIYLSSAEVHSLYKLRATRFSTEIAGRITMSSRWRKGRHDYTM